MITSIAISIFGLMIGRRIFVHFDQNQIFSPQTSQKLWIAFIYLHVLMFFLFQSHFILLWCYQILSSLLPVSVYLYQDWTRKVLFRKQVVPMLDVLVLQMRSGRTLREALENSSGNLASIQYYVKELNSLLQFGTGAHINSKDLYFSRIANELLAIHRTPVRSIERLKALRSRIRTEQDFRQRSQQATTQVKLQATVLSVLYAGLVSYVVCIYPWNQIEKYLVVSGFFFLLGLSLLLAIPRSFRWKT